MKMKEMRDGGETTHVPPMGDKLLRDQELQHLVTSSIPSPPFSGLSLINTSQGITILDPFYSAHLFASIAAANPGSRFQLPIPIPICPQTAPRLCDYSATLPVSGLTSGQLGSLPNAQLEILSSWVNQQAQVNNNNCSNNTTNNGREKQRKISGNRVASSINNLSLGSNNNKQNHDLNTTPTNNNKNKNGSKNNSNRKRGTNFSVSKANKKNKGGGVGLSSEDGVSPSAPFQQKESDNNNKIDMNMTPTIIPIDKPSKNGMGQKILFTADDDQQSLNNNNNNNAKGTQHQQSNYQQSRDKVFTCPICSRCFGYKHVLQNHERTHTGEKPYFCKICEKRFTRDHHLKTHMRLHTGEKPYNCSHCDKQFVQVANLRRHLRVHTGEKPYSCELCDSRFSDSNQLKAHMLIHKGQKPYYCEVCTMRFRRRHHLTQHKCVKPSEEEHSVQLSPPDSGSPPSTGGHGKRERKSRETRRIIRVSGLPVATVTSGLVGLDSFISALPEQTVPEDLSVGSGDGGSGRGRNFSGSHSSVSASSPSPSASGGSRGSLGGRYCHSISSNEHSTSPEYYNSDEEKISMGTLDRGRNESDQHPSPSLG